MARLNLQRIFPRSQIRVAAISSLVLLRRKNPLHQGDEVISVSEFASSVFHLDTYRDILSAFIYPPITDLKIQWHSSSVDPAKGIASIKFGSRHVET